MVSFSIGIGYSFNLLSLVGFWKGETFDITLQIRLWGLVTFLCSPKVLVPIIYSFEVIHSKKLASKFSCSSVGPTYLSSTKLKKTSNIYYWGNFKLKQRKFKFKYLFLLHIFWLCLFTCTNMTHLSMGGRSDDLNVVVYRFIW